MDGVYVTRTRVGTECFDSVTNIGNRPTFGADSFAIEPSTELPSTGSYGGYGSRDPFFDRVREEIKFPSVDALQ
jgi:riboflavin kinase/FMN adenylyltransferase